MGLLIVIVIGAIMGWLASIVVEREDRAGTALCVLAGVLGSMIAAVAAGDVPLMTGVSPSQLLWSVAGAALTIVAINAAIVTRLGSGPGDI